MFDASIDAISKAYDEMQDSEPVRICVGNSGYVARNGIGSIVAMLDYRVGYGDEIVNEISDSVSSGWTSGLNAIDGLRRCVFVEDISVDRKYRRMGIARSLLERLVDEYGDTNQIVLRAFDNNGETSPQGLAEMYAKFGFREIADAGEDGIVMLREAE